MNAINLIKYHIMLVKQILKYVHRISSSVSVNALMEKHTMGMIHTRTLYLVGEISYISSFVTRVIFQYLVLCVVQHTT